MSLKNKIKFISQSISGREITIKDDTGFIQYGKNNGYGIGNKLISEIQAYHIFLSNIDKKIILDEDIAKLVLNNTNPLLPTISQFANGQSLTITSGLLQDNGGTELLSSTIFKDGVLDINMYTEFEKISNIVIDKNTNYITDANLLKGFTGDAILVNNIIYQIDKSKDNNGGTILYIIGYFKENFNEFSVLYRSNIKVLLTAMTDNMHNYAVKAKVKNCNNYNVCISQNISYGLCLKVAAIGFFNAEVSDYITANDMLNHRYNILKSYV